MKKALFFLMTLVALLPWAVNAQIPQLNEGFEGTTFPPQDWTPIHVSGAKEWVRTTSYYKTGSASAQMQYASSGHENYLVTPKLVPEDGEALSFYVSAQTYSGTTVTIEVSTTTPTASAFTTTLATYTTGSSTANYIGTNSLSTWVQKTISADLLEPYVGQEIYIAFHVVDNDGSHVCIDDVTGVSLYVPSCPKPTGLAAALTPGNGSIATLSWTKGGEETNWVVEYSTASDFTGATQVTSGFITTDAPSISVNLTGLTAEQTYYARVKADCGGGDESEWSNPISFTPTDAYTLSLNEGSGTNYYVPIYYYYISNSSLNTASQFIIPASDLNSIQWANIEKLTFYANTATANYGNAEFTVYAGETAATTQTSFTDWNTLTEVYTGSVSVNNNMMEITFDNPFSYTTGNLLIGIKITTAGTNPSSFTWKGVSGLTSGVSLYSGYSSTPSTQSFLPQVTISYTPGVAPSCLPPTTPQEVVNTASTNSVQLTWTVGASETAWDIYYTTSSSDIPDENTTPSRVNIPDNPYTLDGLTHSTHYYVYVRANCGDEQSLWSQRGEFATACDAVTTFPWRENFESYTANTTTSYGEAYKVNDPCWLNEHYLDGTGSSGTMTLFQVSSNTQSGNSTKKLQLPDMKSGTQTLLRLPEMTLPSTNYQFVIDFLRNASGTSYTSEGVRVYASTNGEIDGATELGFLYRNCSQTDGNIVTSENSTGWYTYEFPIPFSGTCYIILRGESQFGSASYMDNLVVEQVPTCRKPSYLTCITKTAHTATLNWINGEEEQDAWQIAYSTNSSFAPAPDFVPNGTTEWLADVYSTPATITIEGLAQSTTYYAYVRANCGTDGYSDWSVANATFTTLAGNVTPTGLAVAANTITSTEATASWNAVAGNTLHESYDIYWAEATFTAVPEEPAAPNFISGINTTSQLLSGLTAETEYKVWVRDNCGNDGYSAWSSAVTFTTASACQTPDGLAANSVTNNSATLSWNAYGQTGFNLQYRVSGEEWDANNIISNVNTPYSMNPILTGNTTYQVRVQATCTADPTSDDSWSNVASFTTACDAEPFPWSENFDNWTSKSVCWSFRSGQYNMGQGTPTTNSSAWTLNSSYGSNITIDGKALTMNLYSTYEYWAVTPAIDITTDDAVLKVDVAVAAWSSATPNYDDNDTLAFAISTDGGNTFTNLRVLDGDDLNNLGNDYTTIYVPVAGYNGQAVRFAIYGGSINNVSSSNDNRCVIDNVSVEEAPSCYPVGTLAEATDITPFSAKLSWGLIDNTQDGWRITYATNAELTENMHAITVTSHENYTLSGLTPETHYYVAVCAFCGAPGYGAASNIIEFTTGIACQKPTDLAYSNLQQTSVDLSWTENGTASAWKVAYKAEDAADFSETMVLENPYTLGGLTQGTNYTVKVRAICGGDYGNSQWSDEITFMTVASCPAPTNLAVTDNSETAHGATITWEGEAPNFIVEYGVASVFNFSESFDGGSMPDGWSIMGLGTSNWSVQSSAIAGGTSGEMLLYYDPSFNGVSRLVLPAMDLTGISSVTFSFKQYLDHYGNTPTLGIATSSDGGTTWHDGWHNSYSGDTDDPVSAEIATEDVGQANVLFCIYFSGNSYNDINDWYFDDIVITGSSLPSSWTVADDDVPNNANAGTYTFNTLDPETTYCARVKGNCGSTTSPYSNIVSFTTTVACPAPTGLSVDHSSITHNSVGLSWTASGTQTNWVVAYKADGDADFTEKPVTENPCTLGDLAPETQYTVKVKTDCGNEGSSTWSNEEIFTTLEACGTPTAFTLGDVEAHQASFSWTAGNGNTAWKVYVKKHVDADYPDTYTNANAAAATINELDDNTTYDVKIVPTCDETKLLEVANAFTTMCNPQSITYTMGFEADEAGKFDCWTPIAGAAIENGSNYAHNSTYYLKFSGTTSNMIALPQFNEATNNLRVEFWTRPESKSTPSGSYYYSGKFAVGYMTDITDASTFVAVETYNNTDWAESLVYVKKTVDMVDVPANATIAMRQFDCSTSYYWFVDDITVKLIPSCEAVSGLTVVEPSAYTVALSWTPGASQETNWKLQYRENGYEEWNTIDVSENDLNEGVYTLDQLSAETTYNWQVAAACSNTDISEYTAGTNFTTLENCPKPTNLTLTSGSETAHGATLTWTAGSTANEHFTVEYSVANEENWIEIQSYIEETTYTINTLDPETSYQVRVSAICGTYPSGYSNVVEFTTLEACPAPAGLAADNATQNTVDLTWNATDAQTYNVQYRTAAGYDFSFTEGFEGGSMPEGWSRSGSYWSVGSGTGSGYSGHTGSATDNYNATCYISTGSSTSDMLITPSMDLSSVNNATLSFNYRNDAWGSDINQFHVYYRVNGGDWNQLYENLEDQSSWTTEPININLTGLAANYQIGFECKTGSGQYNYGYGIGIDDVTILGGEYHEAGQWQSASTTDNTPSLQLPNLTANTNYEVQVQGVCDNTPGAWSSSVNFTTEAIPEFTVTFVAGNSGTCNTTELTGITVELPAATPLQDCAANGWTFAGWTTTELTENTTTAPTPLYEAGTSYTPSASLLMYAVYMRTEGEALPASYNLVTEEPNDWSGDYLIAYATNNVIFNSSQENLDANNALNVSQYWNGNTIASNETTDAQKVTIAATGNGNYSLRAANGKYFGNTSTNNALVSRTSPAIDNTISLDASGNADIESNSTYLRLNTGSGTYGRFRYYGSGQQPIQLYRYTSATPVTYAGAPDCNVPVSYNITVTQVQGATITAPSTAAAGDEIQLIIVPEDGYALNEWQVTTSTGPVTVTNNSFVMPAANVNVTATLFNVYTVAATAVPANGGTVNGAGSYSNSYNEGDEITLTAAANTGYDFTGWYNGDDQVSPDNSYTFTVTGNVTLEARFTARYTVTFNAGNGSCATTSLEGSTVDLSNVVALPSALCVSQGWEFAGWSETSVDETTTAPTLVNTSYSPASDIELYAVYSKTDAGAGQDTWTMATSIAVGDVVVMVYEGNVKKELTAVSGNIGTATDYTTLPAGTYPLTVEQGYADNSYAFKNNSNYLALTGNNNNLYTLTEKDNRSSWTVTSVSDGFDIKNVSYDTRYLQYNTSSPRFACYTHTQEPVRFYKLIPGDVTTYNSNPNCINSYVITAEANDAAYGTVTGTVGENAFVSGAEYVENTVIVLQATANEGYTFVNWKEGNDVVSTEASYHFTATGARNLVANFEINSYEITATANPTAGGTVSGGDTYNHGATVTLTATANEGYTFTNWTKSGEEVSTESTYSFAAEAAGDYVANFTLNSYEITATANPTEGGTVSGAGTYSHGANVTLIATANNGYHFVNWTENDAEVSTDASYSFTFTGARNLVANFAITPAGLSLSAQDFTGYTMIDFNNWKPTVNNPNNVTLRYGCVEGNVPTQGGVEVDATTGMIGGLTNAGYIVHTPGTYHIYAVHDTDPTYYYDSVVYTLNVELGVIVALLKNIDEAGTAVFADYTTEPTLTHSYSDLVAIVAHGQTVRVQADPATGYHFNSWQVGDNVNGYTPVSTEATYTYTVPDIMSIGIKAVFDTNTYALNVVSANETMGIAAGSTTAKHFLNYEISATPNTGYHFTQWSDGNTQNPRTVTLTENTTYTAEFAVNSYAITTGVLPANSGSVTGAGTFNYGANATLTAIAETGYTFTNWTENGVVVNATNPYEFQVTGERELVANFSLNTYAVSASANPANGGSVEGAGTYNHGATVTMEATPAAGYAFVNWTEDGQEVSTDASYTFTFTEGRTLVANFTPIIYTVTFNPGTGSCQTASRTGSIESSINIDAVTATPEAICGNQDWEFAGWSTASVTETEQAPAFVSGTEYIPTDNITLYAVYKKTVDGEPTSSTPFIDFSEQGYTNGQAVSSASIGNNITVNFFKGTNNNAPKYYTTGAAIRCYGGNYFTVSTDNGTPITNIALTFGSGEDNNTISTDNGDYSNGTWTGNENSVKFTISGTSNHRRIAVISVTTSVPTTSAIYNSNPLCYVYAVNVDQNIEHGSVVADQTTNIVAGTEITLTPTPETGYHFGIWNVTAGNDPVTVENNKFTMPESNVNVSALFWIDTLTVNVNANPAVGGTVSGAGDYEYGDMVTLSATANTGYTFVNWTENNQEVSTSATYEFIFNGEAGTRTFVANFSLNSYEITASANPTAGGTVGGAGTYNHGATANLTANPATGYHFVNWTKDGDVVSTSANYSFTVAGAGSYVANFELNSYTIAATANPTAGGTVSGAGTYNHFANVTLTATVSNGYDFIGWYRGNDQVATSLEYSFEATEDVTLEARFATRYTITFVPGSHSTSTIEPRQGSSVTEVNIDAVTADPSALCVDQDWEFAGWSSEAITETTVAPTTWVSGAEYPTSDITLYAVYKKTEGAGNSDASINFSAQGYTNQQEISSVAIGNNVNVAFSQGTNANNAPKYFNNGSAIRCYGGNTFTVTATETSITNITLTFSPSNDTNTISANSGTYNTNGIWTGNENSVTFTISGTSGNKRIAGMSVTTFSGTVTYNSDPECFVYDVVVNPNIEHGTVTADPNTGVIAGTEITLTNTPSEGYHFAGWDVTAGNDPVTVENNKFLMPESDVNVSATFEPDTFTLTINYSIVGGGDAPQSYSVRLPFGTPYSVATPVIAGLTPSQEVVSGTMPAHDETVEVTYSTVPYTLTVHYVYADNTQAAEDAVRNLAYNVSYTVTSPIIEGYTPDQAVVSGTMGEADVEVTVVYSINSHNLTVNYVNEASAQVAESHTATLNYHDNYSVFSPQVAGYAANKSVVSGTMGDADKTETVTYYLVETSIVDATNCAGTGTGSLTVTAPLGSFEYSLDGVTFQTEPQFANLNAGDYTLYIRPTGEDYNYSGVWTVNSNITMPVAVASSNPFYCLDNEINLSGNGSSTGSEYTYAWSGPNNFTANDINATIPEAGETHSGTYTLAVTNTVTNCVSEATVDVIVNTPNMNGYLFTIATHGDAYANLVNGDATPVFATPTVQHYLANAGCNVTLSNDAEATYHHAGDYTITWTAEDACGNRATTTQVLHVVLGTCPVATDYDGNTYPVVALNNLCWMAANLRTTHYSDSRPVPNLMVYSSDMYPDATANLDMFGYLYDWTAAMDAANGLNQDADGNVHGICPAGWRMPKESEIRALVNDGARDIFDLRTTDQWLNNFGTNTTGFSLLPAGCYNANNDRFENLHGDAYIWGVGTSTPTESRVFWADCKCYNWQIFGTSPLMGFSVRCVKEN